MVDGENHCHLCRAELPPIEYAPQSPLDRSHPKALNRWCLPTFEGRFVTDAEAAAGQDYAMVPVCRACHDLCIDIESELEAAEAEADEQAMADWMDHVGPDEDGE